MSDGNPNDQRIRRLERIVGAVLAAADDYLSGKVPLDESTKALVFALAAIRRMADLIEAELSLAGRGRHSVTRVIGRSVIELWLYANDLLLDGDEALDRLFGEDAGHRSRLEHGRRMVWERLESRRPGGIDLQDPAFVRGERIDPNIEVLAQRVHSLREARGIGGSIAEVRYQLQYRWDSAQDVHVTVDLLFKDMELDPDEARILRRPLDELDLTPFRGPDSVHDDARLLADILGVYLKMADRESDLERLKAQLAAVGESK